MSKDSLVGREISLQDDRILSVAWGLSPEELGEKVGMDPGRAIARAKWLLRQRDVWTAIEQEDFLFRELLQLKDRVKMMLDNGIVDSRYFGVLLSTLKQIGQQLSDMRKRTAEELNAINDVQSKAILEVVENAYYHAVRKYEIAHPEADLEPLTLQFVESLKMYAMEKDMEAIVEDEEIIDAEIVEDRTGV